MSWTTEDITLLKMSLTSSISELPMLSREPSLQVLCDFVGFSCNRYSIYFTNNTFHLLKEPIGSTPHSQMLSNDQYPQQINPIPSIDSYSFISYEKVKTFKYLGSLLTNQNSIQEEIKCRHTEGNSCYYSVQTLLSSWLLSKNLEIKIYKTIILPVVQYGSEALREERRLRVLL